MSASYLATYTLTDGMFSYTKDGSVLLSALRSQTTFVYVKNGSNRIVIDMQKVFLREPALDLTMTISNFVAIKLTDQKIALYESDAVPTKDPNSMAFENRLNAYDALQHADIDISFTSLVTPDIRNDRYLRSTLNDLVMTSSQKDFTNTLVSVNGVFHRAVVDNGELFVEDGFGNIRNTKSGQHIGMYDTTTLGGHTAVPIYLDNIINTDEQNPLNSVYLNFPQVDFRNKTVLLVVGGYIHILDGTYKVIGQHSLKIDMCKIDFINEYLHNPNTIYFKNYGSSLSDDNSDPSNPSSVYKKPTVHEMIMFWLKYHSQMPTTHNVAMSQYEYSEYYSQVNKITKLVDTAELMSPAFIYKLLTSRHSFLVVINNPTVYLRKYPLTDMVSAHNFEIFSEDTPRGIMMYNHNKAIPYIIFSSDRDYQHNFFVEMQKIHVDAYKTAHDLPVVPSPHYDLKDYEQSYPIELIELYAP